VGAARAQHLSDVEVEVDAEWLNTYKNEIGKKLLSLMYMEIVIEREGGLEFEGDLERLEKLYGGEK
jgi:hypothetical protein